MPINQTSPASSPTDTLKALVHRNVSMLEYVTDQLGGGGYNIDEDLLEFLDGMRDIQYKALGEHVEIETNVIGRYNQHIVADFGYIYDDGSPVVEHFESSALTTTYYPRYDGTRDAALARHYRSAAEMNMNFAKECEARAGGREWPPSHENAVDSSRDDSTVDA